MTPEEQKVFDALKAENEQLKKNQAEQNSYITKLEAQRGKAPAPAGGVPANDGLNSVYQHFIEEQMREKTLAKAIAEIKTYIKPEEYAALEKDFLGFLDQNMKIQNCTKEFIVDAFNLVLGRARMRADHPINQLGKNGTPAETPATNGNTVAAVQQVLASQPPVMSDKDKSAASGNPVPNAQQGIKTTKDAFAALSGKFRSVGEQKYQ